jgi:hypothetical protein
LLLYLHISFYYLLQIFVWKFIFLAIF